jgi:signal transduction histidine kinase
MRYRENVPPRAADGSTTRVLLVAFSAVVASFLAATALSIWSSTGIRHSARSIMVEATPTLLELSEARVVLGKLHVRIMDALDRGMPSPSTLDRILFLQSELDAAVARYERPPTYPGETELWPALNRAVDELREEVQQTVLLLRMGGADPQRSASTRTKIRRAIDAVDALVERARAINSENASELATHIDLLHDRSIMVSIGLDAISVLLTIGVGLLVRRMILAHSKALEARARELDHFAGRVAHDLLSPLTAVSLAIEVGQRLSTDPQAKDILARGRASLHRTRHMADGLLAFARAAAQPEPHARADLAAVLAGVMADQTMIAQQKGIALSVEPFQNCALACSPAVLTSLIDNLIHNAIKYTTDSPVRQVIVRIVELAGRARVEVLDSGPGVPPGLESAIFEPFVRAPGSSEPGVGLGLATVRRMAEAHDGQVGMRDAAGGGTCFWFELPLSSIVTPLPVGSSSDYHIAVGKRPLRPGGAPDNTSELSGRAR